MRWRATSPEPTESLRLYLGLPLLERATREVMGPSKPRPRLREVSGDADPVISGLLERLRAEVMGTQSPSALYVQGIGQCLAVHLIRHYRDERAREIFPEGGLPAFKLHKVISLLEANLAEAFELKALARVAGLSEFHFSRMFKRATGFSPSHYLVRLRMATARRLLRETEKSVIDIGLEVGYGGASHFASAFRREVGVTPTEYRQ
jgi:AraC family transcriptional regulator